MITDEEDTLLEEHGFHFMNRCSDGGITRPVWDLENVAYRKSKDFDIPYETILKRAQQLSLFVDMDREILGGLPRIRNTRIPVYRILNAVEEYGGVEVATKVFRSLTIENVQDALRFAANVLESPVEYDDPNPD